MTKTRLGGSGTPLPDDGYGRERLPYPFSYVVELTQDYNIDVVQPGEPGAPDDICNLYVVALTPQQELWFTSALQAGADLIYPTFWQDLMNLWENARLRVNTFDFVSCGEGEDIPTFCERVLECIENNPPGDQPGLDDFQDIEAQQKAIVCGSIEFAVEEIMQQGEVVLDIIEAAASVANALADILQQYGRFGAVPTAVQGAVSGLIGAVAAARSEWQAQSTEDAIRCGLYCAVIENGGPPYTLSEETLGDGYDAALEELGPLTLKGLVLESTWYFIPKRLLASRFQVGVDQGLSSSLCNTLCEPCVIVPECRGLSFLTVPYQSNDPNPSSNYVTAGPTWVSGEGYRGTDFTVDVDFNGSTFQPQEELDVNEIRVSFGGIGTGSANYTISYLDTTGTYIQVGSGTTGNGTVSVTLASYQTMRGIRVEADREFQFEVTAVAVQLDPATRGPNMLWPINGGACP